jgi:hypothetical protein
LIRLFDQSQEEQKCTGRQAQSLHDIAFAVISEEGGDATNGQQDKRRVGQSLHQKTKGP